MTATVVRDDPASVSRSRWSPHSTAGDLGGGVRLHDVAEIDDGVGVRQRRCHFAPVEATGQSEVVLEYDLEMCSQRLSISGWRRWSFWLGTWQPDGDLCGSCYPRRRSASRRSIAWSRGREGTSGPVVTLIVLGEGKQNFHIGSSDEPRDTPEHEGRGQFTTNALMTRAIVRTSSPALITMRRRWVLVRT